ncbi:transcription-repair coupling factor [Endomicrobium proavitum]|uniref:Transcription-repair-coupling factor n=1 Tax=Endomicrobium proavitum TaxID=1408281 RepID=A0A0G3WJV8_9BACT|nr:transcription-repair coupling factor [Endomicrobium proavitum]AKL98583.1 Transcription-repair-coupling factor [Endomicrobium proavitum]
MSKEYISGVSGGSKAHFLIRRISEITTTGQNSGLRVFAFVKDEKLNSFYEDVKAFSSLLQTGKADAAIQSKPIVNSKIDVLLFPSDDAQLRAQTADKIKTLKNFIVCASDVSSKLPVAAPNAQNSFIIKQNENLRLEEIVQKLISFGYERVPFVEDKLQFAVRGDIVDVWPAAGDAPVRILFEYETVEALRTFDPGSQLSNSFADEIKILSANISENSATIKEYFKRQSEKRKVESENNVQDAAVLFFDYAISAAEEKEYNNFNIIINDALNSKAAYQGYKSFTGFSGDAQFFVNSLKAFAQDGVKIKIYFANEGERERISDIFHDSGWSYAAPEFVFGNLSKGFYIENQKLAYVSSREMLYKKSPVSFPKIKGGRRLEGIWEISAGDYVVHEKYGIGRYAGLKTIAREDRSSEYLCIEYTKGDRLYVPPDEIKTVKKYIGAEGVRPKLYSMDTLAWERVKSRAREAAAEFAKELLNLYAQRSKVSRAPFSVQTPWEKELSDAFAYDETPDQLKAIEDVEGDFSKPYPMERLVCGDVGYGKTEVAVRAAFKVVQNGMQAAVLVPTTVLARQHFNTFSGRLSPFPTKIAALSRFQSKSEQKTIIESLKNGQTDIVIGTHRLLQKDVEFKKLGLLIVDEEHRFGVKQKEKIKKLKADVDVLMLSATPIPRTLSSALSGFRDLSVIETPPFGRLPIETALSLYDEKLIKNIINAELSRNGQVFYVYNKVETILTKAEEVKKLSPAARVGVIHGQMHAKDIEEIMYKFTNMEIDVLIATTIIESGIDIPSVNTMIVEEAENFGLSQLYQLRGRIGRDRRKAYCYLFYKDKTLSGEAVKRLEAMKEFSELGSGFRLALKDLEIRGAGGILSASQSGFVRDIGYEMFSRLLEQEGKKIKGEASSAKKTSETEIDLRVNALIPQEYIEQEDIRILFYRKLSDAKNFDELEKIKTELADRFGKIPPQTQMLFQIAALRIEAVKLNIDRISEDSKYIYVYFCADADFSKADVAALIKNFSGMIEFLSGRHYAFKLNKSEIKRESADFLKDFLRKLKVYFV